MRHLGEVPVTCWVRRQWYPLIVSGKLSGQTARAPERFAMRPASVSYSQLRRARRIGSPQVWHLAKKTGCSPELTSAGIALCSDPHRHTGGPGQRRSRRSRSAPRTNRRGTKTRRMGRERLRRNGVRNSQILARRVSEGCTRARHANRMSSFFLADASG
jgi:hypothetical protein